MVMLAIGIGMPWAALAGGNASLEYAVKASYLYKFAPFVAWPPTAFASADSPLRLCIAGEDPFGTMLADVVKGQQVQGHPVVVEHPDAAADASQCHILFVGRAADPAPADLLRGVAGHPVLTVTDLSHGIGGGMIQFVLWKGRVRFLVNAAAADASGVQISSKLLELAVKVER